MRRLVWGFAGCTYHIVGNLMSWLDHYLEHFHRLYMSHIQAQIRLHFLRPISTQWLVWIPISRPYKPADQDLKPADQDLPTLLFSIEYIWINTASKVYMGSVRTILRYKLSSLCIDQGCGIEIRNAMPDLSDLVQFHSWQVRNFLLLVLCQVLMKTVNKQCLLDTPRTVRVSEKT